MTGALILLAVTVAVGALLWLLDRGKGRQPVAEAGPTEPEPRENPDTAQGACCGLHAVCRKWGRPREELYYDDEELDRFAGRDTDAYADEEIEQWRDVLYTLPDDERADWGAAIDARGLQMPAPIKEEWRQLVADARRRSP